MHKKGNVLRKSYGNIKDPYIIYCLYILQNLLLVTSSAFYEENILNTLNQATTRTFRQPKKGNLLAGFWS